MPNRRFQRKRLLSGRLWRPGDSRGNHGHAQSQVAFPDRRAALTTVRRPEDQSLSRHVPTAATKHVIRAPFRVFVAVLVVAPLHNVAMHIVQSKHIPVVGSHPHGPLKRVWKCNVGLVDGVRYDKSISVRAWDSNLCDTSGAFDICFKAGISRKSPDLSCDANSGSTLFRIAASPAQALIKYAERSAGSAKSKAARKIDGSSSLIDQHTTDRDSSRREEMSPTIPWFRILSAKESQIGFMHQRSRLQSLPGPFASQLSRREPS